LETTNCFELRDTDEQWLLCAEDFLYIEQWACEAKKMIGKPCQTDAKQKKKKILQPLMIVPLPSPDCEKDWNYNFHGEEWVCRCNEGRE
jgi:hypothetical protein